MQWKPSKRALGRRTIVSIINWDLMREALASLPWTSLATGRRDLARTQTSRRRGCRAPLWTARAADHAGCRPRAIELAHRRLHPSSSAAALARSSDPRRRPAARAASRDGHAPQPTRLARGARTRSTARAARSRPQRPLGSPYPSFLPVSSLTLPCASAPSAGSRACSTGWNT